MQDIVARASGRVFVGLPLCKSMETRVDTYRLVIVVYSTLLRSQPGIFAYGHPVHARSQRRQGYDEVLPRSS